MTSDAGSAPRDEGPDEAAGQEPVPPASGRRPGPWSWALLAAVAVFVGVALVRNWSAVQADLALLSWTDLAAAGAAGALAATMFGLAWRALLVGLGESLGVVPALGIFYVGQLGKYIPGSVWTAAVQAELGRQRSIRRSTMIASYVFALLTSVAVGSVVGVLVLFGASAQDQWQVVLVAVLASLLVIVPLVRPRLVAGALSWLAAKAGRDVPILELSGRRLTAAVLLSLAGWLISGLHLWFIVSPMGAGASDLLVVTGAFALAFVAGILVVPLPAGAGVREGVLVAAMTPVIGAPAALTASLVSRFVLLVVDLILGLAAGLPEGRRWRRTAKSRRGPEGE